MTLTPSRSSAPSLLDEQLDAREQAALAAGDRGAWERQYRALHGPLYGYCLKLCGDESTALDLVQETFAKAIRRCRERGTPAGLRAYLYTSARNSFIDDVRRRSRTDARPAEDVATDMADDDAALRDTDPDAGAMVAEQRDDVREALATLPDRQRQALALCDMEGCSYAQVGEALDLNENAVAQLVFRARGRLRLALRLRQVDESSLPEECRGNLEPISRMLDGALKGAALEQLEAHLDECEACRGVQGDFELVQQRYRAFTPLLGLGAEDAWAGLLTRYGVGAMLTEGIAHRWTRRSLVMVATFVLLLLLATGVGMAVTGDQPSAPLRAAAASDEAPEGEPEQAADDAPARGTRPKRATRDRGDRGAGDDEDQDGDEQEATGEDGGSEAATSGGGSKPPRPGRPKPAGGSGSSGSSDDGASGEPDAGGATQEPTTTAPTSDPVQPQQPDPTPPPPPAPDPANLVANSVSLSNNGGFDVSISNTGETAAGGFSVRVRLGNGQSWYGSSNGVAAGGSTTVHVSSGSLCEGTITFTATVDVYGAVSESNEGDNTASNSASIIC